MKVFVVCSSLNGGGAERFASLLASGLSSNNDVFIATNLYLGVTYNPVNRVVILNIGTKKKLFVFLRWLVSIFKLRKHIKKEKPDIIIGVMALSSFVSKIACLGLKMPIIMTEHNAFTRPNLNWKDYFAKFYLNRLYDCVTVLSEDDKKCCSSVLKNVVVMRNPLCYEPSYITEKEKIILAVGRLDAWYVKGFDLLISAWGKIASKYEDWKLVIAGQGNDNSISLMENFIKQNNVEDRVVLAGFTNNIIEWYKKSSIFVLSSRWEGFGLVLIEAMSQSCACIAADFRGRQNEIISKKDEGILCDIDNVDSLSSSMSLLIDNQELRSKIQFNAYQRSKYYQIETVIKDWNLLIKDINEKL